MENAKPLTPIPVVRLHMRRWALPVLMTVLALAGCSRPPDESRLRGQLATMQQAIGQRDAGAFMQGVAEDFDGNGDMDRAALHKFLRVQILANTRIGVVTGPQDVQVSGQTARVRFTAVLSGGSGRFVPDSARIWKVDTGWRVEGDDWRLHYARWE
ncbi:MAG: nuclear transport factor 2 family protein [Pseudoxanthomonas sp.]